MWNSNKNWIFVQQIPLGEEVITFVILEDNGVGGEESTNADNMALNGAKNISVNGFTGLPGLGTFDTRINRIVDEGI